MSLITGFEISDGRDLIEIFQRGTTSITTNFKRSDNVDLGQIFRGGNSGIITNYQTNQNGSYVDLGSIFETILPFTASGDATATGVATGDKKYYYAVFTNDTDQQVRYTQAITYNNIYSNLNMIVVGGGGGGGSSSVGESPGGGGGGAVWIIPTTIYSGVSYDIYVGQGGYAGGTQQGSTFGGEGGNSTVWRAEAGSGAYIINCLGGKPGNNDGAGDGGLIENPSGLDDYNGGGGGDRDPGDPCTTPAFTTTELPTYLVNAAPQYISNSYSGGGGGSKGNSDEVSFSGGYAGYKGAGGPRGIEDALGSDGQDGRTINGEAGYGGGGGAGGFTRYDNTFPGGAGAGGIVIVYAPIIIPETNLPFSAYGASLYGSTTNTSGIKYCYAVFIDTTNNSKYVTTIKENVRLNAVVVGGGGGGGGTKFDHSPGGGGGGGVYKIDFGTTNNQTYIVTVGTAGIGGPALSSAGTAGGTSQVTGPNATLTCTGGTGGTTEGKGFGGTYTWNSSSLQTGGNGGEESNGDNSSYYIDNTSFNKLGIPDQLVAEQPDYISYYYSGGGGGSKSQSDSDSYGGGYGGNTLVSNTSSGQGGLRGPKENLSTTQWNGRPGVSWGGGGGSGGYKFDLISEFYPGGNGYQGIVIIYAEIV